MANCKPGTQSHIAILGSTGFLGRQALSVIKSLKGFNPFALACEKNYKELLKQAHSFDWKGGIHPPRFLVIYDPKVAKAVKSEELPRGTHLLIGEEGMMEICAHPEVETILFLAGGTSLLRPLLLAIEKRKKICLASKELVVGFGKVIFERAKEKGVEIIPIDSEISAIRQCLSGTKETNCPAETNSRKVLRVAITSSGGPFFRQKNRLTLESCLRHPVWRMGKKITVDSATLMNKGFEVIETVRFFSLPPKKVSVLIHPQVSVHAFVQFIDGRVIAQVCKPDMRLFLQYALTYPLTFPSVIQPLDLSQIRHWDFFPPDYKKFPCLEFAYRAIERDGSLPVVLTAADEIAVNYFLQRKIKFFTIPKIIEETLAQHHPIKNPTLSELLRVEREAFVLAREVAERMRAKRG